MEKYFIITIDTEPDDQWSTVSQLTTQNTRYLPRFQELCNAYNFKPVYLTDYTVANDDYFVGFMREQMCAGNCEIGMHLHAWDTPPTHPYDEIKGNKPYLIEYPQDIMEKKIAAITELLEKRFGVKMVSHRSGRWAINEKYVHLLKKYGYKIDCSVTPGIDWSNHLGNHVGGSDYTKAPHTAYYLTKDKDILEVPVTVRKIRRTKIQMHNGIAAMIKSTIRSISGKQIWLRPSLCGLNDMESLIREIEKEDTNYIEFMMHSSEFMPGGSPYYQTQEDVDGLFICLRALFDKISQRYKGVTLMQYGCIMECE